MIINTRFTISSRGRDLLAYLVFVVLVVIMLSPLLASGQIVFSDLAFGAESARYLDEIDTIWNARWSTPALFNLPRYWLILPFYGLSLVMGGNGEWLLKPLIVVLCIMAGLGMRALSAVILSSSFRGRLSARAIWSASWSAAVLYALNPWVIIRIQHVYLLVGYAGLPLLCLALWNLYHADQRHPLRRALWTAAAYSLIATSQHYFIFGGGLIAFVGVAALAIRIRSARKQRQLLSPVLTTWGLQQVTLGVGFAALSSLWLFPYVMALVTGTLPSQSNVNVASTIDVFSRYSSLSHVLTGTSYWWPMFDLSTAPVTATAAGIVLAALALLGSLTTRGSGRLIGLAIIIIALLATGTYYGVLRELYLVLVFRLPSFIGLVFRDPNKLVGLLYLPLSLGVALGVARLMTSAFRRQMVVIIGLAAAWMFSLQPWQDQFLNGFYRPPTLPAELGRLTDFLRAQAESDPDARVLFLPLSRSRLNRATGYTTPNWNILQRADGDRYRATSDVMFFNTPMNTLSPHEGASRSIEGFYRYLEHLLDTGQSHSVNTVLMAAGIDWLVYQTGYSGFAELEARQLATLNAAHGLAAAIDDGLVHVFHVTGSVPQIQTVTEGFYTTGGYATLGAFAAFLPNFNAAHALVFLEHSLSQTPDTARSVDAIDARDLLSLVLAELPPHRFLFPAGWSYQETGWLPSAVIGLDFERALEQQHLGRYVDDFDFSQGIVYSDQHYIVNPSPSPLPVWLTTAQLLEQFQQSSGVIQLDDSVIQHQALGRVDQWLTTHSALIPIDHQTAVQLKGELSADNVRDFHLKLHFYTADREEIGVEYVYPLLPASRYADTSIDAWVAFPSDAEWVSLEVLTKVQRDSEPMHWTLHALEWADASSATSQAQTQQTITVDQDVPLRLFARVLVSEQGGEMGVGLGDQLIRVSTLRSASAHFEWLDLGIFTPDRAQITMRLLNLSGFNAVNALAVAPVSQIDAAEARMRQRWQSARLATLFDLDRDVVLNNEAGVISPETDAIGGSTLRVNRSVIDIPVEIFATGDYRFILRHSPLEQGETLVVTLLTDDGIVAQRWSLSASNDAQAGMMTTELSADNLAAGSYQVRLDTDSQQRDGWDTVNLSPLDPNAGVAVQAHDGGWSVEYPPSSVDSWQILTSQPLPVMGGEYALSFTLQSTLVRDRHVKLLFFDAQGRELPAYYFELQTDSEALVSLYSTVVTPPAGAQSMILQVLAKSSSQEVGSLRLEGIEWIDLAQTIALDALLIRSADSVIQPADAPLSALNPGKWEDARLELPPSDHAFLVLWRESPSPLWRIADATTARPLVLNGVHQGFRVDGGNVRLTTTLEAVYRLGYAISGISLVALMLLSIIWRRR